MSMDSEDLMSRVSDGVRPLPPEIDQPNQDGFLSGTTQGNTRLRSCARTRRFRE